jgi:DNA invertase Pin-like site-specific DNA recombinase
MKIENYDKAIIYCRVSDPKQTTRGDGLGSQETRCREIAAYRNLEVIDVFRDSMTGELASRPGMNEMIAYLRRHRGQQFVVLIDDGSRLARDIIAHRHLRDVIRRTGAVVMTPAGQMSDDDPDLQFAEGINALQAEHHRLKNRAQTSSRMRARVLNGFWVYQAPWGYRYGRAPGGGRMLYRDEPMASIVQSALEAYASGRLESVAEVARFLLDHPEFPKNRYGLVDGDRGRKLLIQPLYAGYLELPRWKIGLRKAQHEALISLETHQRIQERLAGKTRGAARLDLNTAFPLRGHIVCDDCSHPLTANWSKGEFRDYAYYLCRLRGCVSYGKSIARAKIETAFEEILKSLAPTQDLVTIAEAEFRDAWADETARADARRVEMRNELVEIDRKIEPLLDRIVETDSRTIASALERRVEELEERKLLLKEKIETVGTPKRGYDETFRTAIEFLANPWNLWASDRMEDKRMTVKLAFAESLRYSRKEGFRTPKTSLPFKVLGRITSALGEMARPERFERPTLRFVVLGMFRKGAMRTVENYTEFVTS